MRVPLRYWLFSDVVPGLYIEKGWVHESITYSYTPPAEETSGEEEEEEEEEEGECHILEPPVIVPPFRCNSPVANACPLVPAGGDKEEEEEEEEEDSIDGAEAAQSGALADVCRETTVPKQGQNLW